MNQDLLSDGPGAAGRGARLVGAGLLVLLLGSGAGLLVGQLAAGAAEDPPQERPAASGRTVVLLTGGAIDVGAETLSALRATGTAEEQRGSGFLRGTPPLGQKVTQYLPDPDLDLVVVQGGEIDAATARPPGSVEVGALHLVDRVRAGTGPRTAVVLVGPVPATAAGTPGLLDVRDQLRTAAAARGVPFLDPVALGWTTADTDLDARLAAALLPLVPAGA